MGQIVLEMVQFHAVGHKESVGNRVRKSKMNPTSTILLDTSVYQYT